MKFLRQSILLFTSLLFSSLSLVGQVKVATLSPLLADLANNIGGDKIVVVDLLGKNANPHSFSATPKTLQAAAGSHLYLAFGKNMEPYLPKLKQLIGEGSEVVELGEKVRSLNIKAGSEIYVCCPHHSAGAVDPHWWHSLDNWQKAAKELTSKLEKIDPNNKAFYKQNSKEYRKKLSTIKSWAKKELAVIPKENRQLATAHAAFGYFCKEFGFKSIPLSGLNSEQPATPKYLEEAVGLVKSNKVKAIFPDESSNAKILKSAAAAAGVKLGGKIYADTHTSIEGMFIHNVSTIVAGLK